MKISHIEGNGRIHGTVGPDVARCERRQGGKIWRIHERRPWSPCCCSASVERRRVEAIQRRRANFMQAGIGRFGGDGRGRRRWRWRRRRWGLVGLRQRRASKPLHHVPEVFLIDVIDRRRRRLLARLLLLLLNNAATAPLEGFSDLAALPVDTEIVRVFATIVTVGPSATTAAAAYVSFHCVSLLPCHSKILKVVVRHRA